MEDYDVPCKSNSLTHGNSKAAPFSHCNGIFVTKQCTICSV